MNTLITLITAGITFGTVLMYGTLGEILTEKSGNLNLGAEGIMYMGGAFGLAGAFYYEKAAGASVIGPVAIIIALLCAFLAGCAASAIYSFLTITLRTNQNVTGLALSIFGTGVGQFVGELMRVKEGGYVALSNGLKNAFAASVLPDFLVKIPIIGPILFSHTIFFYMAVILAVAMWYYLSQTRSGMYLTAVGESPSTSDAAGINILRPS